MVLSACLDGFVNSRLIPGFDPRNVTPVASRYIDYGIPTHPVDSTGSIFKTYLKGDIHSQIN